MRSWLLLSLFVGLALATSGCNDGGKDKDARTSSDGTTGSEGFLCRLPNTIADCDAPPNNFSTNRYYCWGCTCAGPTPVAACNGWNGDCRFFANGCYPKTYTLCDQNAPDNILGLCQFCFFSEAGPAPCNKLLLEAGAGPKDSGATKH